MSEERLIRLLDENREELSRVDGKASLLLAVVLALASGFGLAVIEPSTVWRTSGSVALAAAIIALGLALTALTLLGLAAYPATGTPAPGQARYFGEQAQHDTVESLLDAVNEIPVTDRHGQQVLVIAQLLDHKYRMMRAGVLAGGLGVVAFAISGLITTFY